MSMSARKPSKLKFDLNTDRGLLEAGSNGIDGYKDYLTKEESRLRTNNKEFKGFGSEWSPGASGPSEGGPFEGPPDLAQVRIVHSVGMVMDGGNKARADILWPNIVSSILDKEVQERLKKLSAVQSLPASVKIANATVGDNVAYRNMCHVKVFDAKSPPKLMNTQHLYKKSDGRSEPEGGFVLEEPPQLTDTFKHYWYISNSMLTSCAYKQESSFGTYVSIPKNSDAARLMYYVLVIKNGAGAGEEGKHADNVTGLDTVKFGQAFSDNNDTMSWRFPETTFNEVSTLLSSKLKDVRDKSFNCETIRVEVEAFDVFREHILSGKGKIPVLVTLEIDLHLPLMRDAVEMDPTLFGAEGGKAQNKLGPAGYKSSDFED